MKKLRSYKKERLFDKKTSQEKIAALFYKYPYTEFTLSEIAEEAGVSKSMTSSILGGLAAAGFIVLERLGKKLWRIRANNESFQFKKWKTISNLAAVYDSYIVEFLDHHFGHPKAIILFGSFRSGEDEKDSDIDIAVETVEDRKLEIIRLEDFKEIESALERKIRVHVFNRKHMDMGLFNNIANGIVLYGFLEVNK